MCQDNVLSANSISNKQWQKLGDRIRLNPKSVSDNDLRMLQVLRLDYKEPLAKVFSSLESIAQRVDKDCICTCRVKRIESLISKILRLPEMAINRAEDIAGCRCIVHNEKQVYQIHEKLCKNNLIEIRSGGHDYIANPKPGGYRSLHVIISLKDDRRRIEIQIRTVEQHNWSTLVEITDLLYGSQIKEYNGTKAPDLYKFHQLLSKRDTDLSYEDKHQIADTAIKYNYLERVGTIFQNNYVEVRQKWNKSKLQKHHFFLISADSSGNTDFAGFSNYEDAEAAYFSKYLTNNDKRNIVLAHLDRATFSKISMAYSNYILAYNAIIIRILTLLSEATIDAFNRLRVKQFKAYYEYFLDTIRQWMWNQKEDIVRLSKDPQAQKSKRLNAEWANTIDDNVNALLKLMRDVQFNMKFKLWNIGLCVVKNHIYNEYLKSFMSANYKSPRQRLLS